MHREQHVWADLVALVVLTRMTINKHGTPYRTVKGQYLCGGLAQEVPSINSSMYCRAEDRLFRAWSPMGYTTNPSAVMPPPSGLLPADNPTQQEPQTTSPEGRVYVYDSILRSAKDLNGPHVVNHEPASTDSTPSHPNP